MARSPEFERAVVVEEAMAVFWERGYGRTSVGELVDATGLNPGSLYAAFGSKKGIFLEALDAYNREFLEVIRGFGSGRRSTIEDFYAFLERTVDDAVAGRDRRGCLAVNALLEMSQHDAEIADRLRRHNRKVMTALAEMLSKARSEGGIPAEKDVDGLAAFLVTNLWGMRVMCKARPGRRAMAAVVEGIMTTLTER